MTDRPATKKAPAKKPPARTDPHSPHEDGPGRTGEHDTIEDALLAFQVEMPVVARGQTAVIPGRDGGRGYSYTYADLSDLTKVAIPLLTKHGLVFTCLPRRVESGGGYELAGVLMHGESGQRLEGALPLVGRSAQEIGSSLTYNRRYLLGCLTGIVTDDDEDGSLAQHAEAARAERAQQPTTEELLARLDSLAASQGTDRESITGKWREQRGNIPVEVLPMLAPMILLPLVDSIDAWIKAQEAQNSGSGGQ